MLYDTKSLKEVNMKVDENNNVVIEGTAKGLTAFIGLSAVGMSAVIYGVYKISRAAYSGISYGVSNAIAQTYYRKKEQKEQAEK